MKIEPKRPDTQQPQKPVNDPFDLDLKIEPKRIQEILSQNQWQTQYCGSDGDCTGCGCNTCCSSC
jgi:hypothetical protein